LCAEVGGTAAKEEVPLVNVDVFISSQDGGCVKEGEKKFIFFKETATDAEVKGTGNIIDQNLETLLEVRVFG
jgi:hypothetical protein